jgi:hypothetical protein
MTGQPQATEARGLARGAVGSARMIAFGASNVAPAGAVVGGLVTFNSSIWVRRVLAVVRSPVIAHAPACRSPRRRGLTRGVQGMPPGLW